MSKPIESEPLSYYLQRITSQYQLSQKMIAWLTVLLKPLDDISTCLATFEGNFDLDSNVYGGSLTSITPYIDPVLGQCGIDYQVGDVLTAIDSTVYYDSFGNPFPPPIPGTCRVTSITSPLPNNGGITGLQVLEPGSGYRGFPPSNNFVVLQGGSGYGTPQGNYLRTDLQQAIGVQLDLLGAIVGVNRQLNFQPRFGVSPILDDDTYRVLIKATIARNQWDGRIDSLYPIWSNLFPGGQIIVFDNQDMTMTVVMSGSFTTLLQDLITHDYIVPRPEGVLINYTFAMLPILGFDLNNTFIAGFDVGHWS